MRWCGSMSRYGVCIVCCAERKKTKNKKKCTLFVTYLLRIKPKLLDYNQIYHKIHTFVYVIPF